MYMCVCIIGYSDSLAANGVGVRAWQVQQGEKCVATSSARAQSLPPARENARERIRRCEFN